MWHLSLSFISLFHISYVDHSFFPQWENIGQWEIKTIESEIPNTGSHSLTEIPHRYILVNKPYLLIL